MKENAVKLITLLIVAAGVFLGYLYFIADSEDPNGLHQKVLGPIGLAEPLPAAKTAKAAVKTEPEKVAEPEKIAEPETVVKPESVPEPKETVEVKPAPEPEPVRKGKKITVNADGTLKLVESESAADAPKVEAKAEDPAEKSVDYAAHYAAMKDKELKRLKSEYISMTESLKNVRAHTTMYSSTELSDRAPEKNPILLEYSQMYYDNAYLLSYYNGDKMTDTPSFAETKKELCERLFEEWHKSGVCTKCKDKLVIPCDVCKGKGQRDETAAFGKDSSLTKKLHRSGAKKCTKCNGVKFIPCPACKALAEKYFKRADRKMKEEIAVQEEFIKAEMKKRKDAKAQKK